MNLSFFIYFFNCQVETLLFRQAISCYCTGGAIDKSYFSYIAARCGGRIFFVTTAGEPSNGAGHHHTYSYTLHPFFSHAHC